MNDIRTMAPVEALFCLNDCPKEVQMLPEEFAKTILKKRLTPAQAAGVLVQAWNLIEDNCILVSKKED